MPFYIQILGRLQISDNQGEPVAFATERARLILAYLAVSPSSIPRESLAALFWPEHNDQAARGNLRTELTRLRTGVGNADRPSPVLVADRQSVSLDPTQYSTDLQAFDEIMDATQAHTHAAPGVCPECIARMEQAVALYRGPFLEDSGYGYSEDLDTWIIQNSNRYRRQAVESLSALHLYYEQRREYDLAIPHARRLIEVEPGNEEAHRSLMRIFLQQGKRAAAMTQYQQCRQILATEYGVEPDLQTELLAQRIHAGGEGTTSPRITDPYKGLTPFTAKDKGQFFGRETFIQRLAHDVQNRRVTALVGPSGSGKSSLTQAGLIPELGYQRTNSNGARSTSTQTPSWTVLTMRPGEDPFKNLTQLVAEAHASGNDAIPSEMSPAELSQAEMADLLRQGDQRLADLLPPVPAPQHLLLIIDQFEEVFSLCEDTDTRQAFMDLVAQASQPSDHIDLTILITLRADFMNYVLGHRDLANALQDATTILVPMKREEMRQAIERPALNQGINFEPGLVERLLDDIGNEPGNLPLIQFALTQLWQNRHDGWITHAAYDESQGVAGALTAYADNVFAHLTPPQQESARRVFLQLIQPGKDTQDTRRLATRTEIGPEDWPVVRILADARLVVTNRDDRLFETAEVIHEALIYNWGLLRQWSAENRDFRSWQQRVRTLMQEWEQDGKSTGTLLSGAILLDAQMWLDSNAKELNTAERTYVLTSIAHRKAVAAAAKERQQAAVLAAQSVATAEAKSAQRLRWLMLGTAIAFFAVLLVALFAFDRQQEATAQAARAQQSAQLALARQLSAQAIQAMGNRVDLGLLLSLESLKRTDQAADITNLFAQMKIDPLLRTFLHGHNSEVNFLQFTQDGSGLISVAATGEVRRWSSVDGPPTAIAQEIQDADQAKLTIAESLGSPPEEIQYMTTNRRGDRSIFRSDTTLALWDQERGAVLASHPIPVEDLRAIVFSGDSRRAIIDGKDGSVWIWQTDDDTSASAPLLSPFLHNEHDRPCNVNADGTILAMDRTESPDPDIVLWNLETQTYLFDPQPGHIDSIHGCTFNPDETILATAGFDGTVRLWDTQTGEPLLPPLDGHDGRVLSLAFSPDGTLIASGGTDNRIIVWETATGLPVGLPLLGHENWVRALRFSPDGRILASADASGKIALWQMDARQILQGHTSRVRSVALSPDGTFLVTSSFDGQLILWDAASGAQIVAIPAGHPNSMIQIGFSPDGKTLASIDAGGFAIFWEVVQATGQPVTLVPRSDPVGAHNAVLIGLAFSPDSRFMATGDFVGQIRLWDVASGEPISELIEAFNDGWAHSLAFSPDGKQLAAGSTNSNIRLYAIPEMTPIGEPLVGHTNWVNALVFEGENTLVSGSSDLTIRRWDTDTGEALGMPVEGNREQIWGLFFVEESDSPVLVSLGGQGSVIWWNWQTYVPLGPPLGTHIETESMAINSQGNRIFLGTFDETAQIWQVQRGAWSERACQIADRNLTQEEWQSYFQDTPYQPTCPEIPQPLEP